MQEPTPHDSMNPAHSQELLDRLASLETQLSQAQDGLDHLQRLATMGTLSAMVAHELNNILTPLIGYAQLALAHPGDADLCTKALKKALTAAERSAHITSSLLGYCREDTHRSSAHIARAVDSALGCLARDLEHDRIHLALELEDVEVAMPQVGLEQVLLNLILNARKAMSAGGGTLSIRARSTQGAVHIDLSDTGGGVPPQIAAHLFEPFITHNHTPKQTDEKGTGLGLSICKDLIVSAGGQVSFTSEPGKGTTFHLVIPQAQPLRRSA